MTSPTTTSSAISPAFRAALWMLGAVFSFSAMAIAGRELSDTLDTFEIMFYRSLIGVGLVVSIGYVSGTLGSIQSQRLGLHSVRNLSHFIGQNLWFYAVAFIPLAQLFAFEFSTPLWVALFAPWVLGERWTRTRLLAVFTGFCGILLVARPASVQLSPAIFAAALCAIGFAGAVLSTKLLARHESTTSILFWLVMMQSVFGLLCAGYDGEIQAPGEHWPWVALVAVCGLVAHFCITTALQLAPATVVAPMEFIRLPLISVLGLWLYGEALNVWVFVGAGIILLANLINIRAEATTKQ